MTMAEAQGLITFLAVALFVAVAIGLQAETCDNPTCRANHLIHVQRAARQRTTAQHAWHRSPMEGCDRCDADRRP